MRTRYLTVLVAAAVVAGASSACGGSSPSGGRAATTTRATSGVAGVSGTAPVGRPAPYPFATDQRIGLGAWALVVDRPDTSGAEWRVPVHLTNVSGGRRAIAATTELFGFQDGVSGMEAPVASVAGLRGTVGAGATVSGVVTVAAPTASATPLLVAHTDRIGGIPAYIQLVGVPASAP